MHHLSEEALGMAVIFRVEVVRVVGVDAYGGGANDGLRTLIRRKLSNGRLQGGAAFDAAIQNGRSMLGRPTFSDVGAR